MFKVYKKIEGFVLRIIEKLENQKITLTTWLVSFYAIYLLKALLESYSRGMNYFQFGSLGIDGIDHFFVLFRIPAFLLLAVLFIILLLHFLTGEKIEKISRIALFVFPITLLPPIIDLLVTGGRGGMPEGYFYDTLVKIPSNTLDFVQLFFKEMLYGAQGILYLGKLPSFINPELWIKNLDYGMKIRYGFIFLGFIWYIFLKTKNIFRVFLGAICIYIYIFVLGFFLVLIGSSLQSYVAPSSLNPSFGIQHNVFASYFLGSCLLALLWFYLYNKEKFLCFFRSLRLKVIVNNLAMLGLGLYLGGVATFNLKFSDARLVALAAVSVIFYWLSEAGHNEISDKKADLPSSKFNQGESRALNNVFLIFSYASAYAAGYPFFMFILLRSVIDYLYLAAPFRLRRFPVLATLCRASALLFIVYAGFLLVAQNTIFDFPGSFAVFFLVAFTLGTMVKDIESYQNDKAQGIYTVPVIFGPERGEKIIGLLTFVAFILAPFFFFSHFKALIGPALLAGASSFYLVQSKTVKWKFFYLFLIYLLFGLFFFLTVLKQN